MAVLTHPRPQLISWALIVVFLADFGGLTSFYLLLPVLPQYGGAGLAPAVMMGATVAAEFAVPTVVARFGPRAVLAAGLALIGAPALALPLSASLPLLLAVSLLRGLGLAVIFVVCGALSASLVPAERRG